jgi:ankyrin repeat protein
MLPYLGNSCFYRNFRKEEMVALYLVSQGASVNDVDKHNRSIAHQASYSGMDILLKGVLEKGCDPNKQVKEWKKYNDGNHFVSLCFWIGFGFS